MPVIEFMVLSNNLPTKFTAYADYNIVSGKDCVAKEGVLIKKYASKIFIVTGKNSARKCGALDDFEKLFKENGIEYEIYDGITENPHIDLCREAAKKCVKFGADGVLGIGGGSPLDAAKAIAVFAVNPNLSEEDLYADNYENPLPVFACGTTAGTGSEVTSYSIMTLGYGEEALKKGWGSKRVLPKITFCDARYTMSMPKMSTLATGIDAAAHCIEAYFRKTTGIFVRMYALAGIEMIWPVLKKAFTEELTYEDRERILYGSVLAGLAIENSGTCFPHSAGYAITTTYGIPHGFACGYFTAEFLRLHSIDYKEDVDKFLNIMHTSPDEIEALYYSVLPSFSHTPKDLQMLIKKGSKSKNIHSAMYEGDEGFCEYVYRKVFDNLDKYKK